MRLTSVRAGVVILGVLVSGVAACGSDDTASTTTTSAKASATTAAAGATTTGPSTTATGSSGTLRVLVTNDDGVHAEGIDVLVEALRKLPDTEVTVIGPADNQSGTGSKTSPTPPAVTDTTTASGFPAKSVSGFPADAVIYALDRGGMATRPHVVLSGVNLGANVGPLVGISGTIGAAKAAAQRGIPALASSQGLATKADFPSGAKYALEWLASHRAALLAGTVPPSVDSLNIPTCSSGAIRGLVEVPIAADAGGREVMTSNCTSTSGAPADDVDAFGNGYVSESTVPFG